MPQMKLATKLKLTPMNACTNPVTGKLVRVKQKNLRFFLNQIISAWKQILMMVEIFTTLVDTVLLTAYQIVQPFLDFVLTS